MPTVAPPATTATLLLPGLTSDAGGTTATSASDAFAGLFQSVLAQVVSQASATTAVDQLQVAPGTTATTDAEVVPADVLAGLLALTQGDTEIDTAVNADLLSQMFAALGGNAQVLAQLQQIQATDEPADGTNAGQALAATANSATPATPIPETLSPAIRQFLDRTGVAGSLPTPPNADATPTPPEPTRTELPATDTTSTRAADEAVSATAPQTFTVADAARTAGRVPAVVLQTPVLSDRSQLLPPAAAVVPEVTPPPVSEITAVQAVPAVAVGQPPAAPQLPDADPRTLGNAVPAQGASKAAFAVPGWTNLSVSGTAPAQPAAPTQPAAISAAAATPALTAVPAPAPPAPPAPGITFAVAQPVAVAQSATVPTGVDLGGLAGPSQPLRSPLFPAGVGPDSQAPTGADAEPLSAAGVPVGPRNALAANPVAERPAAATAAPVADQLVGPMVAVVSARPAEGETELRIRLDPPELGTVKLKIVSTGGDVRAELQVTSDAVRRVVESQLPELRQKLEDAGVRVQRMDVTTDSAGNSSAGTARDDRGGRWQEPTAPDPLPFPTGRPARSPAVLAAAKNRVDVTA